MKKLVVLTGLLAAMSLAAAPPAPRPTLDQQSAARLLERHFRQADTSYLLLDAATGNLVVSRWPDLDQPAPLGSLVKPFTAAAYGEEHGYNYPRYTCRGNADRCWLPHGHGEIGIVDAIANSCNAYFRMLASSMRTEQVAAVLRRFGITDLPENVKNTSLVGLGEEWQIRPLSMARAYLELEKRRNEAGVRDAVQGMQRSALQGTGKAIHAALPANAQPALAKTGTAPCVHQKRAPGDGYAIVMYPAESPQWLLMVRQHGVPGARAAEVAGQMLRLLVKGE
jgi:cell division protein FtsI/penicillin-binding protein 2